MMYCNSFVNVYTTNVTCYLNSCIRDGNSCIHNGLLCANYILQGCFGEMYGFLWFIGTRSKITM